VAHRPAIGPVGGAPCSPRTSVSAAREEGRDGRGGQRRVLRRVPQMGRASQRRGPGAGGGARAGVCSVTPPLWSAPRLSEAATSKCLEMQIGSATAPLLLQTRKRTELPLQMSWLGSVGLQPRPGVPPTSWRAELGPGARGDWAERVSLPTPHVGPALRSAWTRRRRASPLGFIPRRRPPKPRAGNPSRGVGEGRH
jgi:hypothetical protein